MNDRIAVVVLVMLLNACGGEAPEMKGPCRDAVIHPYVGEDIMCQHAEHVLVLEMDGSTVICRCPRTKLDAKPERP